MITKKTKVDFFDFVFLWLKINGFEMPAHQRKMTKWIENIWNKKEDRNGLLMAFRNSGKSTLIGLFCAWALYQNNNIRILVLAADSSLAEKMVRNVKHIIEKHILTSALRPRKKEEWASDKFTIARSGELRDPSMLAKGVEANLTGLRADLIICDDVEVPKNCDSQLKRDELRKKLDELDYIVTPDGMQLYIGTPHTFYSIYQTTEEEGKEDIRPYLKGFAKLKLPILNDAGKSVWPERFSEEKIAAIRQRSGELKFASQMMLEAVNSANSILDPQDLRIYDDRISLQFCNGQEVLKIGDKRMISVSCWWDPAFSQKKENDNSVIACVFVGEDGRYYLHDLEYIKVSAEKDDNVASMQCRKVAEFLSRNYIPAIHVETNGIGRFLPGILKQTLPSLCWQAAVLEEYSSKNKEDRILEAFETLLAEKALFISKKVYGTGFVQEMREWGGKNCHDDALDAVAGCLLAGPIRLNRANNKVVALKKSSWQGTDGQFSAITNFKI